MKISFRRKLVKARKFFRTKSVTNFVVIGGFLFVIVRETADKTFIENLETIRLIAFGLVIAISFSITFGLVTKLRKARKKSKSDSPRRLAKRDGLIIGLIAFAVLTIISDYFTISLMAVGFGICGGGLYGIMRLLGEEGLKIWDIMKRRSNQKMFDNLANRPENRRRQSDETKKE